MAELYVYDNFARVPAETVMAGDICALTGLSDVTIGETVCDKDDPSALPTITVSPLPTPHLSSFFQIPLLFLPSACMFPPPPPPPPPQALFLHSDMHSLRPTHVILPVIKLSIGPQQWSDWEINGGLCSLQSQP